LSSPLYQLFDHPYIHLAEAILDSLDSESFLRLRRVNSYLRSLVNNYKPKWRNINTTNIIDASRKGHANVVELLLSKGADANAEIKSIRETALHKASRLGHSEVVEVLLAQGGANVNRVNRNGDTPLHIAAMLGREAVVRSLIAHGAEVNKFYWEWEDTEVGKAGDLGPTGVTNQPLKDRMPPNRALHTTALTPLHMAAMQGHSGVARLLLEAGADPDRGDDKRMTPLHHASNNGHAKVVEILLAFRADINGQRAPKRDCLGAAKRASLGSQGDERQRKVVGNSKVFRF